MNTRKAMSEAIAVLDAPGSQGVGRTMYLQTRWTKVEEPSRSREAPLPSRRSRYLYCTRVYLRWAAQRESRYFPPPFSHAHNAV